MNPSAPSSTEALTFLFHQHPLPMWIYDRETLAFLAVNEAAIEKYGYSRAEFLSMNLTQVRPADEIPRLLHNMTQERPPLQHSGQWRHLLKNGQVIDVEITSHLLDYAGHAAALVVIQDVSEQKQAEAALRSNQEFYRALIQNSLDVIALYAADATILYESPSVIQVLGFTPEEMIGQNALNFAHPDDLDQARQILLQLIQSPEQPVKLEIRSRHQNGSYRWLEMIGTNLLDEPSVGAIVANYRDITDRKEVLATLLDIKESLENAEEQARLGSWELQVGSQRGRWSKQMFRLFDLEPAEFAPDFDAYLNLIHPDDRGVILTVLNQLTTGIEPTIQIFRTNPEWLPLRYFSPTWRCLRDNNGNPIKFEGTLLDVTEQVLAEERIRYQADLIEKVSDAIISTDPNFVIRSWNQAAETIYGWKATEVRGKIFPEVLTTTYMQEDEAEVLYQFQITDFWAGEVIQPHKNGTPLHIFSSVSLIRDAEGKALEVVAVNRNITDRKKLELEKAELAAQLARSQRLEAIGRLAGGIAHDFNNMLVPIIGYADMELLQSQPDSKLHVHMTHIKNAAARAANLTRQILAFSRQQVLALKTVDLNQVITDFRGILDRLLGEHIQVHLHLQDHLHPILADASQLEQVILNLAINARDAMPNGGQLNLETANVMLDEAYVARHVGAKPGPHVLLAVSDTGEGIDAAAQQHIFEPFYTTKDQGKGTGLGLATVFGVVKQHEGNIWVYSEPGKGSTFKVYLPALADPHAPAETTTPAEVISYEGTETVLVVEDEEGVRQLIGETLEAHGYRVLLTGDPEEATTLAWNYPHPIHLLLTDVILPVRNGQELYQALVQLRPNLQVLYMSGYTNNVIVHHGVLDEGVAFLPKPFTLHSLLEKVRTVLGANELL